MLRFESGTFDGWTVEGVVREPFRSRPEYAAVLHRCLRLAEEPSATHDTRHAHYFLSIKPRDVEIDALLVHENPAYRGRPHPFSWRRVG